MKFALASLSVLVLVAVASADLLQVLKTMHQSATFKHLPSEAQVLLVELYSEAQLGQLHSYVNTFGYDKIIMLLAHLPDHEAHLVLTSLNRALQHENHVTHTTHHHGHHTTTS